jgi:hypothetical protein
MKITCRNPECPRGGRPFVPQRASAQYCSVACRVAAHRRRQRTALPPIWLGERPRFSSAPSRAFNADGTRALSRAELADRLVEIAQRDDDGAPKTGRRFYYLALSHGYIRPI